MKMIVVGVGVGLLVVDYLVNKVKKTLPALPNLDPTDPNNVVNQAAESAYKSATGSDANIGSDLYDVTHGIETTVKPDSPVGIAGTSIFDAMTNGTYDN